MILNEIQGIRPLQQTEMKIPDIDSMQNNTETNASIFSKLINGLDTKIQASNSAVEGYILNQGISTHELMIAMENAKHSLQVAVEVRNKIVESYEKITQIGI